MRVTNGMIRNNILLSLNKNKSALSTLEQQMATGKKIQKPSEDPITAVKALKLRTSVREIEQYRSNIGDALSWMGVTEEAMSNVTEVLKRIRDLSVQASSDTLGVSEREKIVSELEQLKIQIQQEGNVNYAGRFVFSGYKTDRSLIFNENSADNYLITESFAKEDIETIEYITDGTPPEAIEVQRLRLGYGSLDVTTTPTINGVAITTMNSKTAGAYEPAAGTIQYLQDTGELIFNEADVTAMADGYTFDFEYEKHGFDKNELVPEHYFECTNLTTGIAYDIPNDEIRYQVSYNQDIQINTLGQDFITTDLIRDIDELIQATLDVPEDDSLRATLLEDQLGKKFEEMIGKVDEHMKVVSSVTADLGSRMNRLELTDGRLENDNLNFTDLMSQNEDIDIAEVFVKMTSYEVVYNASLMSSSKIMQPTLLQFIQ